MPTTGEFPLDLLEPGSLMWQQFQLLNIDIAPAEKMACSGWPWGPHVAKQQKAIEAPKLVKEREEDDWSDVVVPNLARLPRAKAVHVILPDRPDDRTAACQRFQRELVQEEWSEVKGDDLCGKCLENVGERTAEALRGFCS